MWRADRKGADVCGVCASVQDDVNTMRAYNVWMSQLSFVQACSMRTKRKKKIDIRVERTEEPAAQLPQTDRSEFTVVQSSVSAHTSTLAHTRPHTPTGSNSKHEQQQMIMITWMRKSAGEGKGNERTIAILGSPWAREVHSVDVHGTQWQIT